MNPDTTGTQQPQLTVLPKPNELEAQESWRRRVQIWTDTLRDLGWPTVDTLPHQLDLPAPFAPITWEDSAGPYPHTENRANTYRHDPDKEQVLLGEQIVGAITINYKIYAQERIAAGKVVFKGHILSIDQNGQPQTPAGASLLRDQENVDAANAMGTPPHIARYEIEIEFDQETGNYRFKVCGVTAEG